MRLREDGTIGAAQTLAATPSGTFAMHRAAVGIAARTVVVRGRRPNG